jgi:hypothetical protein
MYNNFSGGSLTNDVLPKLYKNQTNILSKYYNDNNVSNTYGEIKLHGIHNIYMN